MINLNDILGYKDMKIFQDTDLFSFSLDSIILANYSEIRLRDKKIVDFCSGNAVVPLILSRRFDKRIEGIEVQKKIYDLGVKSINYNRLENNISLYNCDVKDFCIDSKNQSKYDFVLCNPPYFKNNETSLKNINYDKTVARHEILINLDEICDCAKKILKDNGTFCLIHRTDRLIEIIDTMRKNNIEPKKLKFIYEKVKKNSTLVLIHGIKNGKVGLKIDSPLILYDESGNKTIEYNNLLKEVRK